VRRPRAGERHSNFTTTHHSRGRFAHPRTQNDRRSFDARLRELFRAEGRRLRGARRAREAEQRRQQAEAAEAAQRLAREERAAAQAAQLQAASGNEIMQIFNEQVRFFFFTRVTSPPPATTPVHVCL
jgi:hypothetical protein